MQGLAKDPTYPEVPSQPNGAQQGLSWLPTARRVHLGRWSFALLPRYPLTARWRWLAVTRHWSFPSCTGGTARRCCPPGAATVLPFGKPARSVPGSAVEGATGRDLGQI